MKTIYLSPHLDDAVFSCGGWIWEQTQQGREVEIWTICAGNPPEGPLSRLAEVLHQSWDLGRDAVDIRRNEDRVACQLLGAEPRYFSVPDCIYRQNPKGEAYYATVGELFGGLDPEEGELIDQVAELIAEQLPPGAEILAPLGIGNHVDHELTRKAASRLERELLYYADYPYANEGEGGRILQIMAESSEWQPENYSLTDTGFEKWVQSARQYGSQIPTFWKDEHQLRAELEEFRAILGGMTLWRPLED